MSATLDDILEAIQASSADIVSTAEACRRLACGPGALDDLVERGLLSRIPHMRGRGGSHLYSVQELRRFAATGVQS